MAAVKGLATEPSDPPTYDPWDAWADESERDEGEGPTVFVVRSQTRRAPRKAEGPRTGRGPVRPEEVHE